MCKVSSPFPLTSLNPEEEGWWLEQGDHRSTAFQGLDHSPEENVHSHVLVFSCDLVPRAESLLQCQGKRPSSSGTRCGGKRTKGRSHGKGEKFIK